MRTGQTQDTLRRRCISIPAVTVGFLAAAATLVVTIPLAAVWDLLRGRNLPTVRMLVFGTAYLGLEVLATIGAGVLWVASGGGRLIERPWSQQAHRVLQRRWVDALMGLAGRVLRLRLDIVGAEALAQPGPIVLLCRHASMVDTLIPAKLLFDARRSLRYVLKTELLWDPALDLVGHRLPNHFVDRSGSNTPAELEAIRHLAAGAGADEAVVIFPEGTRWSPERRARALDAIAANDPDRAARFAEHVQTLPPRAGGTAAVLAGAERADVVVLAHTGLEGLRGPREALRLVPFRRPVQVELWRIPRSRIPHDDEIAGWLDQEWAQVDRWVSDHRRD